jgi:RNA polymerase sigma factor for flagellar operon FliA
LKAYVDKDELINSVLPRVKQIASHYYSKFSHLGSNLEFEDLVQIGVIGLIDAVNKYDPTRDNKFETYAEFRIKGAILDELRKEDWLPRYVRETVKKVENARLKLSTELMREPTEEEIAKELDLPIDTVFEAMKNISDSNMLCYHDIEPYIKLDKDEFNPLKFTVKKELKDALAIGIEELEEREKIILSLYFYEGLTLKEISEVLDLTESRISQIRSNAFKKLKQFLQN